MTEKDRYIVALEEENGLLKEQVDLLTRRVEQLERMLGLNSSNSSKPPSSDGLRKKPFPVSLRKKGENPSGGQKGHKGNTLDQVDNPNETILHKVDICEACGLSLGIEKRTRLIKRQVFDIPLPSVFVTEHQAEVKVCECGHTTIAPFPKGVVAPVQYGKTVKSLAVYLSNQQFIPEDRLQQTFKDIFGLSLSTAVLAGINANFAKTVEPNQEAIFKNLKEASVKHLDETGFRIGGRTHWLHVISNDQMTHYRVSSKRKDPLKEVKGIVVHDHWKPYFQMEGVKHALCNAHHLRELIALEEIEKESWAIQMKKFFLMSCKIKAPPIERLKTLYDSILQRGLLFHESQPPLGQRKNKRRVGHNLLIRLRDYKEAVLHFLTNQDVPFTNNQAEQDIRMMKTKQKISGGFRTLQGAQAFCTIRGFISTKRKQSNNIFLSIQQAWT